MAEIEFERRGTPLWAVLLGLIVVALVVWYFVAGREPEPAPGTATMGAPAPTTPTPSAATPATPGTPATPAPAAAPLATYSEFVSRPAPAPSEVTTYVSDGLRRLADAMERQYPANGIQVNLVRAMADSLRLPDIPARRQTDMAQAAFFAAGFAMHKGNSQGRVTRAASGVQLDRPLQQQIPALQSVFRAARDELRSPTTTTPPTTPPPAGAPGAAPGAPASTPAGAPAGATKRP